MLVVMNASATEAEIAGVVRVIEALGIPCPAPLVPPLASPATKAR